MPGYGWDQLVSSMHQGRYEMQMQSGLSDYVNLRSKAGRPPLYAILLFIFTLFGKASSLVATIIQSMITTLVAYLGYKIVLFNKNKESLAEICLIILFLFPTNFLKSGTVDEAPLMLVLILSSLYILFKYLRNQNKFIVLVFSAVMMALSTLTRITTFPVAFALFLYFILCKEFQIKKVRISFLFLLIYFLTLSPYIYRNYKIYGKAVLTVGSDRILLFTLSDEFINSFPYKSPDAIEREYFRKFYESNKEIGNLDLITLDGELRKRAIMEILNSPGNFFKSIITKLKSFLPLRYYPNQNNIFIDIVFVFSYYGSLIFFLSSHVSKKKYNIEDKIFLISIGGMLISGITHFVLSRHLYPIMILMIIYSFMGFAPKNYFLINAIMAKLGIEKA